MNSHVSHYVKAIKAPTNLLSVHIYRVHLFIIHICLFPEITEVNLSAFVYVDSICFINRSRGRVGPTVCVDSHSTVRGEMQIN